MFRRKCIFTAIASIALLVSMSASAQFVERKVRIAAGVPQENPIGIGVKKMQEVMSAKTGGKMKMVAFWGGSLGGDAQSVQSLRGGTLEMVITSSSPLAGQIKEMGIFDFPFLFSNEQEADAVLDGPAGEYFNKRLEEIGLVNLVYWENGFRNLTNNRRAVTTLEDMNGLKIRVMQNNIFVDSFTTWGVNAIPMAMGELYTALEMKAVDGQENPAINIETFKLYEVQKHLSTTRHAYTPWLILYSKKLWDQLNPEEQAVLREAAVAARDAQRAGNRVLEAQSLGNLKKLGVTITEFSPEERNRLREKAKPVYDKNLATYDPEGPQLVFETLEKIRGK